MRHADDCAAGAARLTAPPARGLRRRKLGRPRTRRHHAVERVPFVAPFCDTGLSSGA